MTEVELLCMYFRPSNSYLKLLDLKHLNECTKVLGLHRLAAAAEGAVQGTKHCPKIMKPTTTNGGTFTSSSVRLSSQSHYRSLDQ